MIPKKKKTFTDFFFFRADVYFFLENSELDSRTEDPVECNSNVRLPRSYWIQFIMSRQNLTCHGNQTYVSSNLVA